VTKKVLMLAILASHVALAGCGDSDKQQAATSGKSGTANDLSGLCPAITGTGLVKQCTVNSRDGAVEVVIDSFDDEVARNVCANIANKMTQLNFHSSGEWKLRVFSPYRSDKPMAACFIE
jgi:hypothetical protein